MCEYVPQFEIEDLDWTSGTLRIVSEGGVTVVLFVASYDDKIYVLDVKGVRV